MVFRVSLERRNHVARVCLTGELDIAAAAFSPLPMTSPAEGDKGGRAD